MKFLFICISCLLIFSCGNRRSPTGGPVDLVAPNLAYTIPAEYEQIENNEIILAFSKVMDKTSVVNGLIVSPAYLNKKITWKKNNLHINFTDILPENTNIIVYLNKSIRCDRNNTFDDHIVLTFRNGDLQNNSISGYIYYEESDFNITETHISLLDADSLLIFNKDIIGTHYSFDYLNPGFHTLRAYIDIAKNNRYIFGVDPFFRTTMELPINDITNIYLAVADTVKPNLSSLNNPVNNQVILNFNKILASMPNVYIVDDSTRTSVEILHKELINTQMFLITTPLDSLKYLVQVSGLIDNKGNERELVNSHFDSHGIPDTIRPQITEVFPRNGSVVDSLLPDISVSFNKIMFKNEIEISLKEIETGETFNLININPAGFKLVYVPEKELRVFNSYQLIIQLDELHVYQFIVVDL